jgi:hypothetical protein
MYENLIRAPDMTLDIVYTYVNTTDLKWINKVKKYKPTYGDNLNIKRFNYFGEIIFSLKTVEKYFSWVNNIYIVHDDQEFDISFLTQKIRNKIKFIDHKEIIPNQYLPVFNSMLIEMFISEIPNLTDFFIYLNDDVFFGNYVTHDFFFDNNGIFKHFLVDMKKEYNSNRLINEPHLIRLTNVHNLTKKLFKQDFYYKSLHASWNLNKYAMKITFKLFNNFFLKMLETQRFRLYNEDTYEFLLLSSIMAEHLKIARKFNIFKKIFILQDNIDVQKYNYIIKSRPSIFVINNLDVSQLKVWNLLQQNYLKKDDDSKYNNIKNNILLK